MLHPEYILMIQSIHLVGFIEKIFRVKNHVDRHISDYKMAIQHINFNFKNIDYRTLFEMNMLHSIVEQFSIIVIFSVNEFC